MRRSFRANLSIALSLTALFGTLLPGSAPSRPLLLLSRSPAGSASPEGIWRLAAETDTSDPVLAASRDYYRALVERYRADKKSVSLADFSVPLLAHPTPAPAESFHLKCKRDYLKKKRWPEECAPDTLYSWGPRKKLEDIRVKFGGGAAWGKDYGRTLWATISPAATFCYGAFAVRLKLKDGSVPGFLKDKPASYEQRTHVGLIDFALRAYAPLDSWSHDTPEHFDEIIREIQWWNTHPDVRDRLGYAVDWGSANERSLFSTCISESGYENSEAFLVLALALMVERVLDGKGEVFFQDDGTGRVRARAEHFRTSKPTYFNEE